MPLAGPGKSLYEMVRERRIAVNPSFSGDRETWLALADQMVGLIDNAPYLDATECSTLSLARSAANAYDQGLLGDVRPKTNAVFVEVRSTPQMNYGGRLEQYPGLFPGWGALIREIPDPSGAFPTMLEGSIAGRIPDSDHASWPYMVFYIGLDEAGNIREEDPRIGVFFPEEVLSSMRIDKLFHTWITPLMMRLAEENNPLVVRMYDLRNS